MDCDKCLRPAVMYQRYSGMHLCARHFREDFEKKAKRSIRIHSRIRSGDHIGVLMDGTGGSRALAAFLADLLSKRCDISLVAIIPGRDGPLYPGLETDQNIARSLGISSCEATFREPGPTSEEFIHQADSRSVPAWCGVHHLQSIAIIARDRGISKIALGLDLDDLAVSVLRDILQGDPDRCACNLSAIKGNFLMTPFMDIPRREVMLYGYLKGMPSPVPAPAYCPYCTDPFTVSVRAFLDDYAYRHPASRYALAHVGAALIRGGRGPGHEDPGRGQPGTSPTGSVYPGLTRREWPNGI